MRGTVSQLRDGLIPTSFDSKDQALETPRAVNTSGARSQPLVLSTFPSQILEIPTTQGILDSTHNGDWEVTPDTLIVERNRELESELRWKTHDIAVMKEQSLDVSSQLQHAKD